MQSKRLLVWSLALIGTIGLALLLGIGAGNLIAERTERDTKKMRAAFTEQILEQMEHLQVGDTLPNVTLMDLERNEVSLYSRLADRTMLVFFDYSCENCLIELEHLASSVRDSAAAARIILISGTNPLYLLELREQHALRSPILYDDHHRYQNALGVNTYPFNLFVGRDGVIDSVIASPLGASDFETFSHAVGRR